MAWPTLLVQIALTDPPLNNHAATTWTDISAYVVRFAFRLGRSSELAQVEAGTAEIVLDNSDRRFDPTYSSGAYWPSLQPMLKIRISAVYLGVTYYLFTGYIESWSPDWSGGLDATTTIQCVDAFKYFALVRLNGNFTNETTKYSIETWLTAISWPAADRGIEAGNSQVQPGTFVNTPALQHFQNVAAVENGIFFIDGQGRPIFYGRHHRLLYRHTSSATYGDALDGSELPWLRVETRYDDSDIWNEARITRTGGTEQVATSYDSTVYFLTRTYTAELPLYTDADALGLAEWIVGRYATPLFRVVSVTLDGQMSDSLWTNILGRAISDRVTVKIRPPPIAEVITQECFIEGISMEVAQDTWFATFQLSPANALLYWILEDTDHGVLDVTTRLAY